MEYNTVPTAILSVYGRFGKGENEKIGNYKDRTARSVQTDRAKRKTQPAIFKSADRRLTLLRMYVKTASRPYLPVDPKPPVPRAVSPRSSVSSSSGSRTGAITNWAKRSPGFSV